MELACCSGSNEIIQLLLEKEINFNYNCLEKAIEYWNTDLSKRIIEEFNINISLHSATVCNSISMLLYLLSRGVNVNDIDNVTYVYIHNV